jgi:hypothetical protein
MTELTAGIENEQDWPAERIERAKAELAAANAAIAAEEQRRAAAKAPTLTPAERESRAMRELGEMDAVEARRKLKQLYGFDPAWR